MKPEIGFAIGEKEVAVAWNDGAGLRATSAEHDGTTARIVEALAKLAKSAPAFERVSVTLCRPLAHTCVVNLPPMAPAMAESILTRDRTRHVIGASEPFLVSVRQAERGQWCASFAPAELAEALMHFAAEHGWRQVTIRTSDDALAALHAPEGTAGARCIVVADGNTVTDAIIAQDGLPRLGMHWRNGTADDVVAFLAIAAAGDATPNTLQRISILGDAGAGSAFSARGIQTRVQEMPLPRGTSTLAILAAAGMRTTALLPLRTTAQRQQDRRAERNLAWRFVGGTIAALILAWFLLQWDIARALAAVQVQRADLSSQVRTAFEQRSASERMNDIVSSMAQHEATASRSAEIMAAVATAVPGNASLTAVTVSGDSVVVDGTSTHSTAVYENLRRLAVLERVRLAAPIRQSRAAEDSAGEQFSFAAHVKPPARRAP